MQTPSYASIYGEYLDDIFSPRHYFRFDVFPPPRLFSPRILLLSFLSVPYSRTAKKSLWSLCLTPILDPEYGDSATHFPNGENRLEIINLQGDSSQGLLCYLACYTIGSQEACYGKGIDRAPKFSGAPPHLDKPTTACQKHLKPT